MRPCCQPSRHVNLGAGGWWTNPKGVGLNVSYLAKNSTDARRAMLVVAKRFQGKRQQGWFFFGKHGGDLSFRSAMNAGIGTACLPTIQIGLGLLQALKAFSLERSLCVADTGFNFSFAIWLLDPTGQGDRAIVCQDVAIERIQSGIIDVRDEYALAQIIQDDDPRSATQSTECFLM